MRSRVFPMAIIALFALFCFVVLRSPHPAQSALASVPKPMHGLAQNEVAEACPVTKPPTQPFVPPPPYWRDHDRDQFWYGTESLWTLLGVTGTWNISGNVLESKDAYRTKLTYWRRGFDSRKDKPELTVVAKRLDREAPIVTADRASTVFVTAGEKPAMMTAIDIPSIGCWKLTAQYRGDELSFVVSVQP
jgi:hypothetical protein